MASRMLGAALAAGWVVATGAIVEAAPYHPAFEQPFTVEETCEPKTSAPGSTSVVSGAEATGLGLSGYLPDRSRVGFFTRAYDGPVGFQDGRPWLRRALLENGATAGYGRTFNSRDRPGGFTVYAFQLPSVSAAVQAERVLHRVLVCEFGGLPFKVHGVPGARGAGRPADTDTITLVHGTRLIVVSYALHGFPAVDRVAALVVARGVRLRCLTDPPWPLDSSLVDQAPCWRVLPPPLAN